MILAAARKAFVLLLATLAPPLAAQAPPVRFTTDEAFDAAGTRAYAGRHDAVYAHIDANQAAHVEQLRRWVRQQSVSAQSRGIQEMATLLATDLRGLGFKEVELVKTSGHPGVFGYYDAGAPKTLVVYMMYDVQPEETGWSVGAFDGALPSVQPRLAGSAPYYIFTDRLKLPMVIGGLGHGSGAHAPDEYMVIEPKPGSKIASLAQLEKYYVDVLYALADAPTSR